MFIDSREKGKILFLFNRKTLLAVFHKLFLLDDKDLNDKNRASRTKSVINTYCVLNTCMSDAWRKSRMVEWMPIDEFLYKKQNFMDSRFPVLPTTEVFLIFEKYVLRFRNHFL